MKQTDPQFKLRLPQDLKDRLESVATSSHRSLTAEIVARLEESFGAEAYIAELEDRIDEHHADFQFNAVGAAAEEIEKRLGSFEERMARQEQQLQQIIGLLQDLKP